MVMIYRTLIQQGYLDAATAMERECNVGLAQWDLADNMDLYYVLQDFESYFELKFQKKPVLVKKSLTADDGLDNRRRKPPSGTTLPRISQASAGSKNRQSGASTSTYSSATSRSNTTTTNRQS